MAKPVKTGSILAAALALPGLLPPAHAQVTVPNATLIQFKYLYYTDYQATSGNPPPASQRETVRSKRMRLYMLADH